MLNVRFIKGPSKPFAKLLNEALNADQAREAMQHVGGVAHHAGIKFSDHQFPAPGSDDHAEEVARRKAEGLAHEGIHDPHFMKIVPFGEYPKPDRYDEIVAALEAKGFTDIDYDRNSAWRPEDERNPNKKKSIKKVLDGIDRAEGSDLGKAHEKNMSRIPAKQMPGAPDKEAMEHHNKIKDNYVMRMARHPEEVYGMSADDHPWSAAWAYGHGPDVAEGADEGYRNWYDRFDVSDYDDYDQHVVTDPDGGNVGTYSTDESEQEARDHHANEYPVEEHDDSTEDEPKYHIPDHPELSDKVYDDESDAESARDDWADQNYDFEHPTRYQIYDNHTGDTIYHDDAYDPFESQSEAEYHAEHLHDNDYENQAGEIEGNGQDGSCLSVTGGCNNHYLEKEVKQGTHALYLHHKDDKNFEQPLARIALRPYVGTDPQTGEKHKIIRRSTSPSGFAHNFEDPYDTRFDALDHDGPFQGDEIDQITPTLQKEAHNITRKMFPAREGTFTYGIAQGVYADPDGYRNHQVPAKMSARWFLNQDPSIREAALQDVNGSHIDDKPLRDIVKHKDASADDIANALNHRGQHVKLDKATMKNIRRFTGRDAEKVNAAVAGHLRDFGHDKRNHEGVTTEDIEGLVNSKSDKVLMSLMTKGSGDPTHVHQARVHGLSGEQMNSDGMDDHHERTIENLDFNLQNRAHAAHLLGPNEHGGYSNTGVLTPFAKQIAERHAEVMKDDFAPHTLKGGFGYHPGFLARNPQHTDALFDGSNFTDHEQMTEMLKAVSDKKLASFFDGKSAGKVNGEDVDYHKIKGSKHDAVVADVPQVGRAARFLKSDSPVFSREEAPSHYGAGDSGFDADDPNAEQKFADILKKDTHHGAYAAKAAITAARHPEISKRMQDKSSAASEAMMHHIENADFNQVSRVFDAPYRAGEFFAPHQTAAFAEKMMGLKHASGEGEQRVNHSDARLDRDMAGYIAENHPDALAGYVRHNPRGAMESFMSDAYGRVSEAAKKQVISAVMHPDSGINTSAYNAFGPGRRIEVSDRFTQFMSQNPELIDEIMKHGEHPEGHPWHEASKDIEHPALMAQRLPKMKPVELAEKAIRKHLGGSKDHAARDMYAGEINRRHSAGEITPTDSLLMSHEMDKLASTNFSLYDPSPSAEGRYAESPTFRKALHNHGPAGIHYKDGSPVRGAGPTKDLMTAGLDDKSLDDLSSEARIDAVKHLSSVSYELKRNSDRDNDKIRSHSLDVLGYTRAHENFLKNVKHMQAEYGSGGGGYGAIATKDDHKKMIDEGHYDNRPAGIADLNHLSSEDRVDMFKHLHDHQSKTMGDAGKEANKQIIDHMIQEPVHPDPEIGKWQHGQLRQIKQDGGRMPIMARKNIMSSPHFGEEDAKWMDATKPEEGHFTYGGMRGSNPHHIVNALPTSAAGWDYVTKGMNYGEEKAKDNLFPTGMGAFSPGAVESMQAGAAETKWMGMEDRHHKAFAQYAHDNLIGDATAKTASNMSAAISHPKAINHFAKLVNETSKDESLLPHVRNALHRRQERVLSSATSLVDRGEGQHFDKDMLSEAARIYYKNGGRGDQTHHLNNDHAAEVIDHLVDQNDGTARDAIMGAAEHMAKSADLKHEHKSAIVKAAEQYHNHAGDQSLARLNYGVPGKDNLHKSLMDNGHQDLHEKILDVAPKIASGDLIKGMSNEEFDRHADRLVRHLEAEDKKGNVSMGNAHDIPKSVHTNLKGKLPGTVDKIYNSASRNGQKATNFDHAAAQHGSPETALHLAKESGKLSEAEMNPHLQPHHVDQLLKTMKDYNRSATSLHTHDNPEIRHKAMEHEIQLHEKGQENATSKAERRLAARDDMAQISRVGLARHAMGKDYAPSKEHLDRLVDHHIDNVASNAYYDDTLDPKRGINEMGRHLSVDHLKKIMDHKVDDPETQRHVRQSGALMALNNSAAMEDRSVREKTLSVLNSGDRESNYIGKNTINKMDLSNPKAAGIMAKHMVHRVVGDAHGFNEYGHVVNQHGEAVGSNNFGELKAMLKNHAENGLGANHVANAILKHPAIEASHPVMKGNLAAHAMNEAIQVPGSPAPQHVKDTLIKHFPVDHHVESFMLANKNMSAVKNAGVMARTDTGLTAKDVSRNLEHLADPNHPLHALHPEGVRKNLEKRATTEGRQYALDSGSLGHPLLPKESVKLVPPKFTTDLMHLNPHQTSAQFDHHFKQGEFAGYGGNITKSKHFSPYHIDKVISDVKSEDAGVRHSAQDGLEHIAANAKINHEQAHKLMTAHENLNHTLGIVDKLKNNVNTPASFLRDHNFYPNGKDHPAYSDPEHGHHLMAARADDGRAMEQVKEAHPEAAKRYEQEYGGSK